MSLSLGGCPANSTLFFLLPLLFPEGRSRGLPLVNSLFLLLQFTKLWYISTPIGPSLEWRGCPTERSSHLINITLCKSKPLVSLLGGCGGCPPNHTLPLFFTYFHYHCLKRGPGGLPLVNSLFLLLQSLYCFLLIAILIPRRGIRWVSPWVFRSSSHYKYQNHII